MTMLLSLDKIPRLHNILASFFSWFLLAGFVILPGTFTSVSIPPNNESLHKTPDLLNTAHIPPLLVIAAVCCSLGYLGNLFLALRWRKNYVWLINRVYMPGTLNALAGLIGTLTGVYAQHRGEWSVTAQVAVVVEGVTAGVFLGLFLVYNHLLLRRVKEQHEQEEFGGGLDRTLKGNVERMMKGRAVAPGSIV